ncbi:alpha/beta hydrolase [Paenibacillus albicereus]|uniref:Alpha/beta hydrolase n=1 Tax=Paenibacillus albicereus TaxID=2726185 RepID=A0A6H2GW44_9BACL|nr:alpha/beta hydrolase [Paenibacillus albicereus]QJC51612.1 alpha/beta hydrolase [Paenibacillus albicereus]
MTQAFIWIAAAAGALAALLLAVTVYFYRMAIHRSPKTYLEGDPDLPQLPEPEAGEGSTADHQAWLRERAPEDAELLSQDGLKLRAIWLPAPGGSARTAILAHGYSGEAKQMAGFARFYAEELGWNVLMPDARGHGRSGGSYIGFGWPERKDYLGWIRWVSERVGTGSEIVLHGISMGGATVCMTAGEALPPQVKAIVADCPYTSVKDELTFQLKRMYKLPPFPFLPLTSGLTKLLAGYSFGEASALKQVRQAKVPMLFIHGGADTFVPTWMGVKLHEACPQPKELLVVPGAEHGAARQKAPEKYDAAVRGFLGSLEMVEIRSESKHVGVKSR